MAQTGALPSVEPILTDVERPSSTYRPVIPSPLGETKPVDARPMRAWVDRSGTFDFDKIVKAGLVWKRRKRTKSWKLAHLVLRPNFLSMYNDREATQLSHQIKTSDITAVAVRKDKVGKQRHVGLFGLFTLTRNFHLEAESDEGAMAWVEAIRKEARLDEDIVHNPHGNSRHSFGTAVHFRSLGDVLDVNLSDNEADTTAPPHPSGSWPMPHSATVASHPPTAEGQESSLNDIGSCSSFSDGVRFGSGWDISNGRQRAPSTISSIGSSLPVHAHTISSPSAIAEPRPFYKLQKQGDNKEQVTWHGFLDCRMSRKRVRPGRWRRYWVVLRLQHLALYKDNEEYAAVLIIPLSAIIDVVEIESMSNRRTFCMQVITDETAYRLCASDEDDLSSWMGRIKSALARRKEVRQ